MAYAWNPGMGNVSANRAFELHTRAAIIAATTELERNVAAKEELPLFSWGTFSSPKNASALAMATVIDLAITAQDLEPGATPAVGTDRLKIQTLAVRLAYQVRSAGFGERGWAVVAAIVTPSKPAAAPAPPR